MSRHVTALVVLLLLAFAAVGLPIAAAQPVPPVPTPRAVPQNLPTSPPPVAIVPNVAALPPCKVGPDRSSGTPPAQPTFCRAPQASKVVHDPGRRNGLLRQTSTPQASPAPAPNPPYWYAGPITTQVSWGGFSWLYVENPDVPHPSNDHFVSRVMKKTLDNSKWVEVGWTERGADGDFQQVYVYDTETMDWHLYGSTYPVGHDQFITVYTVYAGGGGADAHWQSFLWWNGQWNLLRDSRIGMVDAEATEGLGEVYSTTTTWNAGAQINYQQLWYDDDWRYWDTSISTEERNDSPYSAYYWTKYNEYCFWKP